MSVRKLRSGRITTITATEYVGQEGTIFWDETTGLFRLSDGETPGGRIVANLSIAAVSTQPPVDPFEGELWLNPETYDLRVYHNTEFIPTIDLATSTKIGGVKLGPGVITNNEGQIIIDSTGLEFSFGDFQATTGPGSDSGIAAYLSSINDNQDIVIASNGTGSIDIVGKFNVYPPDGAISNRDPVFRIDENGDISANTLAIQNTGDLGFIAPLNVTINEAGLTKFPTVITGAVAQFTGRDNRASNLVLDTYGIDQDRSITGGEFVFRTGRGSNASTSAVQSGDRLGSVTAAGWASDGYAGIGVAGLRMVANENFTASARGGKLELFVVPNGTITPTVIGTVTGTGLVLNKAGALVTFSGATSGTIGLQATATAGTNTITLPAATGTVIVTAGANTVTGVLTGSINLDPVTVSRGTASVQTFTITGLTTSHKVIVMPGAALDWGIFISAAWASASNTLSIELQNFTGNQDIDLTTKAVQYFAWI